MQNENTKQIFQSIQIIKSLADQCLGIGFFKSIQDANICYGAIQNITEYVGTTATGKQRNVRKGSERNSESIPPHPAAVENNKKETLPTGSGGKAGGSGKSPGTGKAGGSGRAGGSGKSTGTVKPIGKDPGKAVEPPPMEQLPLIQN